MMQSRVIFLIKITYNFVLEDSHLDHTNVFDGHCSKLQFIVAYENYNLDLALSRIPSDKTTITV